jgi:exosortase
MSTEYASHSEPGAAKPARLTDLVADKELPSVHPGLGRDVWVKMLILGALFVAVYAPQIGVLLQRWREPNWSHGYLIPLFSLYLLYCRWDQICRTPMKTSPAGLVILIASLLAMIICIYPISNPWLVQLTMIPALFGLVLYQVGWKMMKLAWLPVVYLVLAIPVNDTVYTQVSLPLQNVAAFASSTFLSAIGVTLETSASQLMIKSNGGNWYPVTVAEACSGVRSLMAFIALGVALAYLAERPVWQRAILLVMIIPVVVLTNMARVTITCYMYVIDRPELGQKFMHTFLGMLMLIPAGLALWGLAKLMDALFVEETVEEEEPDDSPQAASEVTP